MVRRNISFQYVDDTSLSLIGDEGNVDKVVNLFNLFLMVIRLELNWEKSLAYLPMELCNLNQTNYEIQVDVGKGKRDFKTPRYIIWFTLRSSRC